MFRFTSFILSLVLLTSCGPLNSPEQEQAQKEVRQMLHQYFTDIREKGLQAEFAYLDSSFGFMWQPPGYDNFIHYDSVAFLIRKNAATGMVVDNRWEELDTRPIRPDFVNYDGIIISVVTDSSGKITTTRLKERGGVRKTSEGWKLQAGVTSVIGD